MYIMYIIICINKYIIYVYAYIYNKINIRDIFITHTQGITNEIKRRSAIIKSSS